MYEDMISLFSTEEVAIKQPFRVVFEGERGCDTGGLSREAFSTFWELAYQKHFDGTGLLAPLVASCLDSNTLQILGRILSAGYIFCGFLPIRIAFPTILCILLQPQPEIDPDVFVETFKDCLNPVESATVREAFSCRSGSFSQSLVSRLINVFSRFDCLEVPKASNLLKLCEQSARYLFVTKPFAVILNMSKGIPEQHRPFWGGKDTDTLYRVFGALAVNQQKVLESIEEPLFTSQAEEKVFSYLTQFVSCLKTDELQKFLRFCSGSSVCIDKPITVSFNNTLGLGRRTYMQLLIGVIKSVFELSRFCCRVYCHPFK